MNIIFFTHPDFFNSQSMPRYTQFLAEGMKKHGHIVEIWSPRARVARLTNGTWKKWFGYIDQFVIFPLEVIWKCKKLPNDTLFAVTDHALGPWIPLICHRKHVIHCHDFLAQKSALGRIPEHQTSTSGKVYQWFIRRGFKKGKNFISISSSTKKDLESFLPIKPTVSEVVYNSLNRSFVSILKERAFQEMKGLIPNLQDAGYWLHVGGNSWYKNRIGIVQLYTHLRSKNLIDQSLVLAGQKPDEALQHVIQSSPYQSDIHILIQPKDETVTLAYSGAEGLWFLSLEEGFGWPIIEAMACGCPVITTAHAPMNEVGGTAAFYLPRYEKQNVVHWLESCEIPMIDIVNEVKNHRVEIQERGFSNISRFDKENSLAKLVHIYTSIVNE